MEGILYIGHNNTKTSARHKFLGEFKLSQSLEIITEHVGELFPALWHVDMFTTTRTGHMPDNINLRNVGYYEVVGKQKSLLH